VVLFDKQHHHRHSIRASRCTSLARPIGKSEILIISVTLRHTYRVYCCLLSCVYVMWIAGEKQILIEFFLLRWIHGGWKSFIRYLTLKMQHSFRKDYYFHH
jgi:hypothetical protein